MTSGAALVTGSTRGIGLAAARALARAGFSVAVNGPEDDGELAEAAAAVRSEGGDVVALRSMSVSSKAIPRFSTASNRRSVP